MKDPIEKEPWYDHEDCEDCAEECENAGIEYESNFTWDADNGVWICDTCGRPQ